MGPCEGGQDDRMEPDAYGRFELWGRGSHICRELKWLDTSELLFIDFL